MIVIRLIFLMTIFLLKNVESFDFSCIKRECYGPKFKQSNCCDGYICVSNYEREKEGRLQCVDEVEHLRVKSMREILQEYRDSLEFPEDDGLPGLQEPLGEEDTGVLLHKRRSDLKFGIEGLEGYSDNFDLPVVIEKSYFNFTF